MKDVELEGFRPRPAVPYQPGRQILRVPRTALARTLEIFQRANQRECCCFWYGVRDAADVEAEVRAVVVPQQRQTWGNYLVLVDAMRAVQQQVAPLGLRNLAQVHSHPGALVEHSIYDDQMANSQRALSIVVPHYGHWQGYWPSDIGVHEFQNNFWYRLDDRDAAHRVVIIEPTEVTFLDCR